MVISLNLQVISHIKKELVWILPDLPQVRFLAKALTCTILYFCRQKHAFQNLQILTMIFDEFTQHTLMDI